MAHPTCILFLLTRYINCYFILCNKPPLVFEPLISCIMENAICPETAVSKAKSCLSSRTLIEPSKLEFYVRKKARLTPVYVILREFGVTKAILK